jgi:hypothetical protein
MRPSKFDLGVRAGSAYPIQQRTSARRRTMTMRTMKAAVVLLTSGLLWATAPLAAPITVDFTITSTTDSIGEFYQPGVVGSGFFTFDDALIPAGGTGHIGNSSWARRRSICLSTGSAYRSMKPMRALPC